MRDPVDHLGRRIPLPALLEPRVVVRTDNSQHGDLLTPQASNAAITAGWQADGHRLHPGSMSTQERGQHTSRRSPWPEATCATRQVPAAGEQLAAAEGDRLGSNQIQRMVMAR
jgi:hypothetical protein